MENWFSRLVRDNDVIENMNNCVNYVATLVSQPWSFVESYNPLFSNRGEFEDDIVDVNVVRFPDFEHPYFKVSPLPG